MGSKKVYFSGLNYTLANEDSALEVEILPQGVGHVLCVAGSGGRVLPLLAKAPRRLTCVDLSEAQLFLVELRVEALRALADREYLAFLGYPPEPAAPSMRKLFYQRVRPGLSERARAFWDSEFENAGWESLLYQGRWERTLAMLARLNRLFTGRAGLRVFECQTLEEQSRYVSERFPWRRFRWVLRLAGNAAVFNALLYGGHFPKKNIPESLPRFYEGAYRRLFEVGLARENFFLQLCFFGKVVFPQANPIETHPSIVAKAREALAHCEIVYRQGDFLQSREANDPLIDFASVSDTVSYLSGAEERSYLQRLRPRLSEGARVVARYYLRVCEELDQLGFEEVSTRFAEVIRLEKVQMYRVAVYQKRGR